ncbi:Chromatin remodeling protein EBS [Linum perenne]
MRNRRFAQIDTSDEDDVLPSRTRSSAKSEGIGRKLKRARIADVEEEEEDAVQWKENGGRRKKKVKVEEEDEEEEEEEMEEEPADEESGEEEEEEEEVQEDAKPVGEAVKVSGKGKNRRSHFQAFEFDGIQYELEDPVLLTPEDKKQKPYVAIIKDITQTKDGSMMVTGQWFYRPDEAEKRGGGNWTSSDTRELFYSFHLDEVPAESVMHKCVVHFIPPYKHVPKRKQYPGFIVQKVYDTVHKKLWKLTDKDYEDDKQHEIDLLVLKTLTRISDLPDKENEDSGLASEPEDQSKIKRPLRRRNISPLDVSREDETLTRTDGLRPVTPGSCPSNASEYYAILVKFNALTGDNHRDRCMEKLLESVQFVCSSTSGTDDNDKSKSSSNGENVGKEEKSQGTANGSQQKSPKDGNSFPWPDAAVPIVSALEQVTHETLTADKYNQKLRQLVFNLKNNERLAQRLLNGELEPSKILTMSPTELKEGSTAEETKIVEPEESVPMQMTDARCSRCNEFKVGVRDIIQAGHGDRYQLECTGCGNSWYASRDEASVLTIDGPTTTKNVVGAAPLATAKFDEVEKKLASPREPEKAATDSLKKASEPNVPVLETQKLIGKKNDNENNETAAAKNDPETK